MITQDDVISNKGLYIYVQPSRDITTWNTIQTSVTDGIHYVYHG